MLFNSPAFLFIFLPFVLAVNFLIRPKYRNYFLLLASLFFYAWGETFFVFLMMFSIGMNYLFALAISKFKEKSLAIVSLAVSANLIVLFFFKYSSFFINNINNILPALGINQINNFDIPLPAGISFFTFHAISYIVDIYRKKNYPQKNIFDLGLYISFFPQLIAGPIIRYNDIAGQIEKRKVTPDLFSLGIKKFIIGLAKKVIIADTLAVVANNIFSTGIGNISTAASWLAIICFTLQIYFDFSGYSDMAIGLGRMLGFKFLENFNYPYISKSIREFWTRWHISLSNWFRDYLYIPLGGNRKSKARTYFNLCTVFLLCGLWHGASWTFVVWGAYNGLFLVLERMYLGNLLSKIPSFFSRAYALFVVLIGFVFFRAPNISYAFGFLKTMFGFIKPINPCYTFWLFLDNFTVFIIAIAVLSAIPLTKKIFEINNRHNLFSKPVAMLASFVFYFFIFIMSICLIAIGQFSPFIYFKF